MNAMYYIDEHLICSNYVSRNESDGFSYSDLKKDATFQIPQNNERNKILFFLRGSVEYVIDNLGVKKTVGNGEMLFIPKFTRFKCTALSETSFITHEFEKLYNLCDKMALESLRRYCEGIKARRETLPFQKTMRDFLELLNSYLRIGMLCRHMHQIKQKELFLLMRVFFTKEENAAFFLPIISKDMDFKSLVSNNYTRVKTVQEPASLCNLSLTTFNRLFNDNFHEAPYNWMQKQKAKTIASRLMETNIPFIDIINEFNFSSAAHFTLFCKKFLHMTPSKFRELSRIKIDKRLETIYKK